MNIKLETECYQAAVCTAVSDSIQINLLLHGKAVSCSSPVSRWCSLPVTSCITIADSSTSKHLSLVFGTCLLLSLFFISVSLPPSPHPHVPPSLLRVFWVHSQVIKLKCIEICASNKRLANYNHSCVIDVAVSDLVIKDIILWYFYVNCYFIVCKLYENRDLNPFTQHLNL